MIRSPHEGTPGWRAGIKASIGKIKYRMSVMPDLMVPAYRAALDDVLVHLEAMLERGTEHSVTSVDGIDDAGF